MRGIPTPSDLISLSPNSLLLYPLLDIPPPLLAMLTRLNAAATELLRHFWSTQSMSEASGRDKAERIIMKLQEIRVEVEGGVQGNEAAKETVASLRDAIARVLDHHGSSTQAS